MQLTIIEGKQSLRYNHFNDYALERCDATNTRLMGVVALKLRWRALNSKHELVQILHLDFSEFGIDEYMEYYTDPMFRGVTTIHSKGELRGEWQRVSGSLGGDIISIPVDAALRLISDARRNNENYYRKHDEEIQAFRMEALSRIDLMVEALRPTYPEEMWMDSLAATALVSRKKLSLYETINYFLMRLFDLDYTAARTLSTLSEEELRTIPQWRIEMMTILRNKIRQNTKAGMDFHCTILTQGLYQHFYIRAEIDLDTRQGKRDAKVSSIHCTYFDSISDVEASMQLEHPEYITVYDINVDVDDFDLDESSIASNGLLSETPNGVLYLVYNEDNAHVDSADYYMNNDVYGAYLITPAGELVVMSNEVMKIMMMEMDLAARFLNSELTLTGNYKLDTQIFQTFSQLPGVRFRDILQ